MFIHFLKIDSFIAKHKNIIQDLNNQLTHIQLVFKFKNCFWSEKYYFVQNALYKKCNINESHLKSLSKKQLSSFLCSLDLNRGVVNRSAVYRGSGAAVPHGFMGSWSHHGSNKKKISIYHVHPQNTNFMYYILIKKDKRVF